MDRRHALSAISALQRGAQRNGSGLPAAERTALFRVVTSLRSDGVKSTGKLHGELYPNGDMSRDAFEEILGAMARAGLVRLSDAIFEKNGKQIPYRKVGLTRAAYFSG